MNAPLQLSDSVNILKKGANVCNAKKKINRCANNLCLEGRYQEKNSSPPPKKKRSRLILSVIYIKGHFKTEIGLLLLIILFIINRLE